MARPAAHAREHARSKSEKQEKSAERRTDVASARQVEAEWERACWAEAEEAAKRRKRRRCESFEETVMPLVAGLRRYRLANPATVGTVFHAMRGQMRVWPARLR
jgi:hypothetical protein